MFQQPKLNYKLQVRFGSLGLDVSEKTNNIRIFRVKLQTSNKIYANVLGPFSHNRLHVIKDRLYLFMSWATVDVKIKQREYAKRVENM